MPDGATTFSREYAWAPTYGIDLPNQTGIITFESQPTEREDEPLAKIETRLLSSYLGLDPRRPLNTARKIETKLGRTIGPARSIKAPGKTLQARYLQLTPSNPLVRSGQLPIQGFAVYPIDSDKYVILVLQTNTDHVGQATLAFEELLATVEPATGHDASEELNDALAKGTAFARDLTAEDIEQAIRQVGDRFDRLYRADPGGSNARATERGYRQIRAYVGRRGDITGKPEGTWSNAQFEPGFVVELSARFLGEDPDTGARSVTDSVSAFYLSEDRRSEAWSTRMRTETGNETSTWSMTGSRVGDKLSIRVVPNSGVGRSITPQMRLGAYLSQVESFLLPFLLQADGEPGDFAFRSYQPNLEQVTLRGHSFRTLDSGGWIIETSNADGRIQTTQLSPTADFVRTVLADGLVWDPSTVSEVYDLWRRKRLPLD